MTLNTALKSQIKPIIATMRLPFLALTPACLIPFFLVNNLLLLNQFPDVSVDKEHGRLHLSIKYGVNKSVLAYMLMNVLAGFVLITSITLAYLPWCSLLGLIPILLGLGVGYSMAQLVNADGNKLPIASMLPLMGKNVAVTILTPLIIAVCVLGVSF